MPKRLLMLSWRDQWHPAGGGAELITYRVLQGLVSDLGWEAEWFSAAYPGARPEENRDGIRFVRQGSQATVHLLARKRYGDCRSFDIVVDQTNTIPFWTPLYAKTPVTLFIFQLAREVWLYEGPPLLKRLGYWTEPLLLRPYRHVPAITESESTAQSLRDIGLVGPISIVPICVDDLGVETPPKKNDAQDIVVLGRLVPSKRVEESIKAAGALRALGWNGTLHVVGTGETRYTRSVETLAMSLNVRARFHGRVSDSERKELLSASTLLWMTSAREGWGLVVTEAARHWTPSVVYDSPGLRDSVRNRRTGLVVPPDHRELAKATKELLDDRPRLGEYTSAARRFSLEFSWRRTCKEFERALEVAITSYRR